MLPAPPDSDPAFLAPDWEILGLVLCLVGGFLLANGILFRDPRSLVESRFSERRMALRTIRAFIFHRVQMTLGFAFLLGGFALQLFGRLNPRPPSADPGSPALWIGLVVVAAIALWVLGWLWSLHLFRGHLMQWFREHPPDFERDSTMAREVGELFGVQSYADDTVESYVVRLRSTLNLPAVPRTSPRRGMDEPDGDRLDDED